MSHRDYQCSRDLYNKAMILSTKEQGYTAADEQKHRIREFQIFRIQL
jgi:hypothetical protein